jgi:stage III sporulation protein AE
MRWTWGFIAALLLLLLGGLARAEGPPPQEIPLEELLRWQSRQIDTRSIEAVLLELNRTWKGYGPEISVKDFIDLYRAEQQSRYTPQAIAAGLFRYLVREMLANAGLLAKLMVLAVFAALLQHFQSAFQSDSTSKLAHWVVYLALIGLAVTGFGIAVASAMQTIRSLTNFMLAMLPPLLTILAAAGQVTTAAIFQPLIPTLTGMAASLTDTVIFPLIFLSAMVEIISGLNPNFKLTGLAGLLRQWAMYALGFTFTIFLGVVAVKGAAGAVADGVSMKATKFAMGSFIPVVGKMLADASDLIFGSAMLLKNGLGLLGAIAVFFIAAFPLLKILSLSLVYQVAGALVEPVGAEQVAKMLSIMARSLQLVFASVAVVALMFFVGITILVGAGNLAVMAR